VSRYGTDAQWQAYYAAVAAVYRAKATALRLEADAVWLDPLHAAEFKRPRAKELMDRADRYDAMAVEQMQPEEIV
jgi:hypothetical protein